MYAITMKRGILLAAFGSGSSQGESTLRRFDAQVRKAFPDVSVRWAFTSMLMRERLASERKKSDSVHKALKKMAFEKFTHVAVQPVHVIPGLEYGDIVSDADELRADGTFASLVVGAPLLTESQASVDRAARALLAELGLGDAGGKRVRDWSGGMKRRLALARALLAPSDALALDEPFTGLDADNRAAAQRCVAWAAREKIVLLVSHEDDALTGAEVRLQ